MTELTGQSRETRVLVVDDHEDTLVLMSLSLRRRGYLVETARTLASALAAAESRGYDVLISDIGLPDGSGIDLVRKVRAFAPLPAIALSGFGADTDVEQSRAAGFDEHLIKPVTIDQVSAAIERLLARRDPTCFREPTPSRSQREP